MLAHDSNTSTIPALSTQNRTDSSLKTLINHHPRPLPTSSQKSSRDQIYKSQKTLPFSLPPITPLLPARNLPSQRPPADFLLWPSTRSARSGRRFLARRVTVLACKNMQWDQELKDHGFFLARTLQITDALQIPRSRLCNRGRFMVFAFFFSFGSYPRDAD